VLLAAVGCFFALPPPATSAQVLEELREEVRTSSPPSPRGDEPPHQPQERPPSDPFDDTSDSWTLDGIVTAGMVAGAVITAPFWGPSVWIGDNYHEPGYFPHYPYQYEQGFMMIGPPEAEGLAGPREPRIWSLQARKEFGTNFSGLEWVAGHGLFETTSRFGGDSDLHYITEQIAPRRHDDLWLGDANLVFRFAQSERLVMRSGMGFNFLSDSHATNFGVNFTYGGDFFPVRPFVVSGEMDLGTLGHTHQYHVRGSVGVIWWLAEAYIGYDYDDFGHTQIAGMVSGVRLWH
jgi:hypothetical protein